MPDARQWLRGVHAEYLRANPACMVCGEQSTTVALTERAGDDGETRWRLESLCANHGREWAR